MPYMFSRGPRPRVDRNYQHPRNNTYYSSLLLRQVIKSQPSDSSFVGYILELQLPNPTNDGSVQKPWIVIRNYQGVRNAIGLPVSLCEALLNHLLTCSSNKESVDTYSSDSEAASPILNGASGDASLQSGQKTSPSKSKRFKSKQFCLKELKPIRIVCGATECTIEITQKDPNLKRSGTNQEDSPTQGIDTSRRWITSCPANAEKSANDNVETNENGTVLRNDVKKPVWTVRGALELHSSLMPMLTAFLVDVFTRYREVAVVPEISPLFSVSGDRRFFFDVRDTKWGQRLHISQVTDFHRNVVAIPVEELVSFRLRLDAIISGLCLEDKHALRTMICEDNRDNLSRPSKRTTSQKTMKNGDAEPVENNNENRTVRNFSRSNRPTDYGRYGPNTRQRQWSNNYTNSRNQRPNYTFNSYSDGGGGSNATRNTSDTKVGKHKDSGAYTKSNGHAVNNNNNTHNPEQQQVGHNPTNAAVEANDH